MTQERHINTPGIYPASHCQLTHTLTVSRPSSIEPHGFAFSVPSTSGTVSARKIAQPKKSKGQTAGMATTAHINDDPIEAEPQEDAEIVQAFAAMDLALMTEDVCYQLTQEEWVRQVCRKDMTAILTKLLTKCNATGDTLNTETVVKTLASHCEAKIWRETWEQCYDIDLYVDAMEQKQTDLEIWEAHWNSEHGGRFLFLEHVRNFYSKDEEIAEDEDDGGLTAAVEAALEAALEEQEREYCRLESATLTSSEANIEPVVLFGPDAVSRNEYRFIF